jgi:Uma2 family endonuclease
MESIVIHGVSWAYYEQTLKEIGKQPIRVAFLDGAIELFELQPEEERRGMAIAALVVTLAVERRIPLKCLGSTTFRREDKDAGSEPDECFYFNDVESFRGIKRFDPLVQRAPDLWVEVDVLNPSVAREPIYARLGVPEIWRYSNDRLVVRLLTPDGVYADSATSLALPFLPMAAFAKFIPRWIEEDEIRVLAEFREWVRSLPL